MGKIDNEPIKTIYDKKYKGTIFRFVSKNRHLKKKDKKRPTRGTDISGFLFQHLFNFLQSREINFSCGFVIVVFLFIFDASERPCVMFKLPRCTQNSQNNFRLP